MGMFSFLTSFKNQKTNQVLSSDFDEYFTKELFASIIDTSSSRMLFFTRSQGWIGANKLFFDTFDLRNIEEFRKKYDSVRDVFLNESEDIFTEDDKSWLDYIKKYKPEGYELTIVSEEKDIINISAKCHTIPGNKEFYILELEDITTFCKTQQETENAEKLKSKFLANIGHEFRTPMNGIIGFLDLLGDTQLDKKQQEYFSLVNKSSKNLMGNIETLLDLSQMQAGRLHIDNTTFDISQEMEHLLLNFITQAREKGIKVLTFIDPKLPKELNGDIKKIKQIMTSLVKNAIKFTQRGGKVIIEVKLLKRQISGECSIGFSINDNGKGITEEILSIISEPFKVGAQADERLGVGLSLSHGLINLLGGDLKIKSEEEIGSYFNFVLDFKESHGQAYKMVPKRKVKVLLLDQSQIDEANFLTTYLRSFSIDVIKSNILDEHVYDDISTLYIVADQNNSSWMLKLGTYSKKVPIVMLLNSGEQLQTKLTHVVDNVLRKPLLPSILSLHLSEIYGVNLTDSKEKKIELKKELQALVVEDNLINQRLIKILLQEYKITVVTALNGNEAVEKCSKNHYDIVFMDIDLPEKNGIIATKEIKDQINLNGLTPIVALTAMAMEGDKAMLLNEGLDDYLSKPLTREKLESVLNKYLHVIA